MNGHDNGKHHSSASQASKEKIFIKKDSGLHSATPRPAEVSASVITAGSRSNIGNSQSRLGGGLEASFASLRRSSATPDLLNSSSVFDGEVAYISSKPSSSVGSSSPRLRRPPTKESRSVSICETDVCNRSAQYSLNWYAWSVTCVYSAWRPLVSGLPSNLLWLGCKVPWHLPCSINTIQSSLQEGPKC